MDGTGLDGLDPTQKASPIRASSDANNNKDNNNEDNNNNEDKKQQRQYYNEENLQENYVLFQMQDDISFST